MSFLFLTQNVEKLCSINKLMDVHITKRAITLNHLMCLVRDRIMQSPYVAECIACYMFIEEREYLSFEVCHSKGEDGLCENKYFSDKTRFVTTFWLLP